MASGPEELHQTFEEALFGFRLALWDLRETMKSEFNEIALKFLKTEETHDE